MTTNYLSSTYQPSDLARWIPALMLLLQHYEGIERALEPEEQPFDCLAEKLPNLDNAPFTYREQYFISAITIILLFYYRTAGKKTLWVPGNETFQQFDSKTRTVIIWRGWTPQLSENEVTSLLYANPLESGHVRHSA